MNRLHLFVVVLLTAASLGYAQSIDTLMIQDFETSPSSPTWSYSGTPDDFVSGYSSSGARPPSSPLGIDGSRAWHVDNRDNGNILTFDNFSLPVCYDSFQISLRIAAMNMSGSSGGPDASDYVSIELSTDGGLNYYERVRVRGWSGSAWAYSATGVAEVNYLPKQTETFGPSSSGIHTDGYSTVKIHLSNAESEIRVRIKVVSTVSSDDWLVDNLVLTGIDDGVGGYPSLTLSDDITVNNDSASCGAVVTFTDPIAFDSCSSSPSGTDSFMYTGAVQTFIVPSDVTEISVDAYGAQGGNDGPASGGLGGSASGKISVTPGDTLYIYVGGQGESGPGSGQNCNLIGGFNGGGNTGDTCCSNAGGGAGAGGGASDIRLGGMDFSDRIIVAGGGGGAGSGDQGGNGGGLVGASGTDYDTVYATGGTQTAGGQKGGHYNFHVCNQGTDGTLGQGGKGDGNDGGGGGGGYYGGGGGPNNGGGGGGSSYIAAVSDSSTSQGVRNGNGLIVISYTYTENGPGVSQIAGLPSGSSFPIGITTNTFQTISNGDTLINSFTVAVNSSYAGSLDVTAANSYTSPSGNYTWTESGDYIDTLVGASANGCDSIIEIELYIHDVLFVDGDVSNNGNGQSWSTAYKSLDDAINVANAAGGPIQIWIKKGTYYPGGQSNTNRDSAFVLTNPLAIVAGGFSGIETSIFQRDVANNPTVLCGDIGTANDNSDNSYHILVILPDWDSIDGEGGDEEGFGLFEGSFHGLTFKDANANGNTRTSYRGTIVYRNEGGAVVLRNADSEDSPFLFSSFVECTFENNYADYGAALFVFAKEGAYVGFLQDCDFIENSSIYGTVFLDGSGNGELYPEFINCVFDGNSGATSGSAIYSYAYGGECSPYIENCVFYQNSATTSGGALYNNGYAGYCYPGIFNSTFVGNNASNSGGAIYNHGASGVCEPYLAGCVFYENSRGGDTDHKFSEFYNYHAFNYVEFSSLQRDSNTYSTNYANGLTDSYANLFSADPKFEMDSLPKGEDGYWRTGDDGLRLKSSSPLVNSGYDGEYTYGSDILYSEPMGNRDMGAYEYVDCGLYVKLATEAKTHTATHAVEDEGYICYCNSDNELLLALDTSGTGAVISPSQVKLYIGDPSTLSYNNAGGMISNPDGGVIMERRWDVEPTTQPNSPVTVVYFFTKEEFNDVKTAMAGLSNPTTISTPSQLQFYKIKGGSSATFPNPHDSGVYGTIIHNGTSPDTTTWVYYPHGVQHHSAEYTVSSFSGGGGGGGGGSAPLPIELLEFNATLVIDAQRVDLDWATATELNNAFFTVERSLDGNVWETVSTTPGAGTSSHIRTYTDIDPSPYKGVSLYRLKQTDYDGTFAYSVIRLIDNRMEGSPKTMVFPNPTSNNVFVQFDNSDENDHQISVLNALGQTLITTTSQNASSTIDLTDQPNGLYFIKVDNGEIFKIIKN